MDERNKKITDLESLSRAVKDTLAFLIFKDGASAFEFADGAYHTHQLAKELAYLLLQQGNDLSRKKELDLNVHGFTNLFLAMGQVESWLTTWDKPPEKHPNIVVQGYVDHDFQSWLKTSLARFNTEEAKRFILSTNNYEEAVIAEAKALADGYRIYADIANKHKTEQRPWWRFW